MEDNETMTNAEIASWVSFAGMLYMLLWNVLQTL